MKIVFFHIKTFYSDKHANKHKINPLLRSRYCTFFDMPPENEILDLLARSIRQRKCELVLGPYAHTVSEGPGGAHIPLRAVQ